MNRGGVLGLGILIYVPKTTTVVPSHVPNADAGERLGNLDLEISEVVCTVFPRETLGLAPAPLDKVEFTVELWNKKPTRTTSQNKLKWH